MEQKIEFICAGHTSFGFCKFVCGKGQIHVAFVTRFLKLYRFLYRILNFIIICMYGYKTALV
jgi:hypothetical protein